MCSQNREPKHNFLLCELYYKHPLRKCPEGFFKLQFFVKFSQNLIHQNPIKQTDPRNTKRSRCQKRDYIHPHLQCVIVRKHIVIDEENQTHAQYCPKDKVCNHRHPSAFHFFPSCRTKCNCPLLILLTICIRPPVYSQNIHFSQNKNCPQAVRQCLTLCGRSFIIQFLFFFRSSHTYDISLPLHSTSFSKQSHSEYPHTYHSHKSAL